MLSTDDIKTLFGRMADLRVGVIGDFALDLYFDLETQTAERSLETGQDVFWGSHSRTSLGGAGNVAQNLASLGVGHVQVVGCIGNDLFGREMRHLFGALGVATEHLYTPVGWDTCVYTKPMRGRTEANRIDFGTHNRLPDSLFEELLAGLAQALTSLDVLIINQQFPNPLLNEIRAARLNDLLLRFPTVRCVADMRQVGKHLPNAILKVNTAELARLLTLDLPHQPGLDWCSQQGQALQSQRKGPLLITRGEAGILYIDGYNTQSVAGLPLSGDVDTVGAGDTVVAAFGACWGAGASPVQALTVANLAAAITVQKLHQTGTASFEEILTIHSTYYPYESGNAASASSGIAHASDQ